MRCFRFCIILKVAVVKLARKRFLPIIAVVVVAAATLAGGFYESRQPNAVERIADGYKEALDKVQQHHPGALDLEQLGKSTVQGMLHQLDPHSNFLTKTEFEEVQSEQRSRTYGIGVTIARRHDRVYIMSVTPGGPGDRAGLRYGDAIVAADGVNTEEWLTEQVMHKVRGERGAPVEITVYARGRSRTHNRPHTPRRGEAPLGQKRVYGRARRGLHRADGRVFEHDRAGAGRIHGSAQA